MIKSTFKVIRQHDFLFLALAVFPFGLAIISWLETAMINSKEVVLFGMIYILFMMILCFLPKKMEIKQEFLIATIAMGFCIITRIIFLMVFSSEPIIEGLRAINTSKALVANSFVQENEYYTRFPEWGVIAIGLGILRLFGDGVLPYKVFNLLCVCVTCYGIFYLTKRIFDNLRCSVAAVGVYTLWIGFGSFVAFPYGEIVLNMIFPFFLLGLQYMWNLILERKKIWNYCKGCFGAALLGVMLAIMDIFKASALVLFIAIILTTVVSVFKNDIVSLKSDMRKRIIKRIMCVGVILLTCFTITENIVYKCYEHVFVLEPSKGIILSERLVTGLDIPSGGRWSQQIADYETAVNKEYDYDFEKINKHFTEDVKNMIKEDYKEYPRLFKDKFLYTWGSQADFGMRIGNAENADTTAFDIKNLKVETQKFGVRSIMATGMGYACDAGYIFVLILSFIGSIALFFKREGKEIYILGLYVLGCSLALLIFECHPRYLYSIVLPVVIIASKGIETIMSVFCKCFSGK